MKKMNLAFGFGLVLGAVACSSAVPVGEGVGKQSGALGAIGEAPKTDGTCNTRLTACTGTCVDLSGDGANCGACGTKCTGTDTCNSGACSTPPADPPPTTTDDAGLPDPGSCVFGQESCGGTCIDILFDSANCGGCGIVCSGATKCSRGTCL